MPSAVLLCSCSSRSGENKFNNRIHRRPSALARKAIDSCLARYTPKRARISAPLACPSIERAGQKRVLGAGKRAHTIEQTRTRFTVAHGAWQAPGIGTNTKTPRHDSDTFPVQYRPRAYRRKGHAHCFASSVGRWRVCETYSSSFRTLYPTTYPQYTSTNICI